MSTKEQIRVYQRFVVRGDLPEILAVEATFGERSWREKDFSRRLGLRTVWGVVAEHKDRLAGYCLYHAKGDGFELLRLGVRPDLRRRGVASQIMHRIAVRAADNPLRDHLHALVPESLLDVQLFLRSQKFLAVLTIPPSDGQGEDGYVFRRELR